MFYLLRNNWEPTLIYGVDIANSKFLIYDHYSHWVWVPMDEFTPMQ